MMALNKPQKVHEALDIALKLSNSQNIVFDLNCIKLLTELCSKIEKQTLEASLIQLNNLIEKCTESVHKQSDTIMQFEKYYNRTDVNILKKDDKTKTKESLCSNEPDQLYDACPELKSALFMKEDLIIYRAVISIYLGFYKEAISDFKKILGGVDRKKASIEEDTFKSQRSEATAIDSCCSNGSEIVYNMMVCSLLLNDLGSALAYCDTLISSIQQYQRPLAHYIKSKILSEQGNKKKASEEYFEFMKAQDQSMIKSVKQSPCPCIDIFSSESKLSGLFPYLEAKVGENIKIKIKPSFSLPRPRAPNIIPKVDDKILEELDPLKVPCNPEAPWIRREDNIIRFTEEISPYEYIDDEKAKSREEKSESEADVKMTENEGNNEKPPIDSDTKNGPSELKVSLSQKIAISESSNML
jgi:tetratricopeptide (TPR) repeat protein